MSTDGCRVCALGGRVGKTVDSLPVDRPRITDKSEVSVSAVDFRPSHSLTVFWEVCRHLYGSNRREPRLISGLTVNRPRTPSPWESRCVNWRFFTHRRPFRAYRLRYCSSLTFSNHVTALPLSSSVMAICVIELVTVAPCQCFVPGGIQTTSPFRISSMEPPHS